MSKDVVFEIGAEEIPSTPLYGAVEFLAARVPEMLREARLEYGEVSVIGSPRRIAVMIDTLAERQEDRTVRSKGPAVKAAFDDAGRPTKAAEGFARGKGVAVEDLISVEDENGAYVYAIVDETGAPTGDVLPRLLGGLVEEIEWPKSMRWGDGDVRFSRPVRWMVALYGDEVVPVRFGDVTAGRTTYGHRFLASGGVEVETTGEYVGALERAKVVADHQERARLAREGIDAAARDAGGVAVVPENTFAEVVNLVEWPTVASGAFDEAFLSVPREVLENAMESHQRYFPVEGADGTLLNRFVVVHNGDPALTGEIVRGHERVLRARLADAAFFYNEDVTRPLEQNVERLDDIVFQEKLGSVRDRVERIQALSRGLAELIGAPADEAAWADRAAHLSKADLVASVVVEFPDLQGVMGGYYARSSGEADEVATAIVEHYRPRYSGDEPPATLAGRIVALADKIDSIAGLFAIGMPPTGSADPYGLRRAAIGSLQMMLAGTPLTLDEAIAAGLAGYSGSVDFDVDEVGGAVKEFFVGRLETILRERGHAYDTVSAVLAVAADDPADALARVEALSAFRTARDDMEDLSVAFERAKNLSAPELGTETDESLMDEHELALSRALDGAEGRAASLMEQRAYGAVLETFAALRSPIDVFFDEVLVMAEDERLRANRLRLLNRFVVLFEQYADFSRLVE